MGGGELGHESKKEEGRRVGEPRLRAPAETLWFTAINRGKEVNTFTEVKMKGGIFFQKMPPSGCG